MEKFICDAMLGRLARWLRALGYDTTYHPEADDAELIRRSWLEGRTILTRDTRLAARRAARRHLVIQDDQVERQLRQVVRELALKVGENAFSRCICCNQPLQRVRKEEVKGIVPPYVYATQESFSRCPSCGRRYWKGTHWQRMVEVLQGVAEKRPADADGN
jgi:hypothetical protein